MDDWRNELLSNPSNSELEANALTLIRQCAPTDRISDDFKLVLLFKYLTFMRHSMFRDTWFIEAVKPFVRQSMLEENHIGDIVRILTIADHFSLLEYFHVVCKSRIIGSEPIYYAYMMILEKSKEHLKNT